VHHLAARPERGRVGNYCSAAGLLTLGSAWRPEVSAWWTSSRPGRCSGGPLFRLADWPNDLVPRRTAGVYAVWRAGEFLYAGMSGRGARREDFVVDSGQLASAKGLWTRLNSHASGRRSGDQFNL
jgi:hypothetical protein